MIFGLEKLVPFFEIKKNWNQILLQDWKLDILVWKAHHWEGYTYRYISREILQLFLRCRAASFWHFWRVQITRRIQLTSPSWKSTPPLQLPLEDFTALHLTPLEIILEVGEVPRSVLNLLHLTLANCEWNQNGLNPPWTGTPDFVEYLSLC